MKKVIKRLLFIAAFLALPVLAQEQEKENSMVSKEAESFEEFDTARDELSEKYMAGPHLVFDCEDKHWVCVADDEKKNCEAKRDELKLKKERQLSCTYFRTFESKKECFTYQQSLISNATDPTWTCTVDKWRFQTIKFE